MYRCIGPSVTLRPVQHSIPTRLLSAPFSTSTPLLRTVSRSQKKKLKQIQQTRSARQKLSGGGGFRDLAVPGWKPEVLNWEDVNQVQERPGIIAWEPEDVQSGMGLRGKGTRKGKQFIQPVVRREMITTKDGVQKEAELLGDPSSLRYKLKLIERDLAARKQFDTAMKEASEEAFDYSAEYMESTGTSASSILETEAMDEVTHQERMIEIGDMVDLRLDSMTSSGMGVVVGIESGADSPHKTYLVLDCYGALLRGGMRNVKYHIAKHFCKPKELQPIIGHIAMAGDMTKGTKTESYRVPDDVCKYLCDDIRDFMLEFQECFAHITKNAQKVYEAFALENEYVEIDLEDAMEFAFIGVPKAFSQSITATAAVRKLLLENSLYFRGEPTLHKFATTVHARPLSEVRLIANLPIKLRSIRNELLLRKAIQQQKPLATIGVLQYPNIARHVDWFQRFIGKCQKVIDRARGLTQEFHEKKTSEPIKPVLVEDVKFDKDDLELLDFLKAGSNYGAFQKNPAWAHIAWVLEEVGRYNDDVIAYDTLQRFLAETGIKVPWQNPTNELGLLLGVYPTKTAGILKNYDDAVRADKDKAWKEFGFKDRMADIRKDWGDLPIYAIDSVDTIDIDDGISIEEVSDTEAWIHVHIANPTAFIPQQHELAELAQLNFSKIYFPEKHIDMLPAEMNRAYFGVEPGNACITFSGKFDRRTGELLEEKVQSGRARVVKRIPYTVVNEKLGLTHPDMSQTITVGPVPPSNTPVPPEITLEPSQEDLDNLRKLYDLTNTIKQYRFDKMNASNVEVHNRKYQVKIDDGAEHKTIDFTRPDPSVPVLYTGFPLITLKRDPSLAYHTAETLVAECMISAGRIAGSFLASRKLPAPFRASNFLPDPIVAENLWKNIFVPMRQPNGLIPESAMAHPNWVDVATTKLSTHPYTHRMLGIRGYVQATSPLRRAADFVTHYQIENALLAEAAGKDPRANPAWSEETMQDIVATLIDSAVRHRAANEVARRFWVFKALTHAVMFDMDIVQKPLRGVFKGLSLNKLSGADVLLEEWGVVATLKGDKEALFRLEEGDVVEGRVIKEECDENMLVLKFERVVKKASM